MTATFTAVFEQDGDWWVGYVEELPGANTQGATLDEARENLREASHSFSKRIARLAATSIFPCYRLHYFRVVMPAATQRFPGRRRV